MGTRVGRSTLFGIPLQQQWSYANSGDFAPTYYLQSDAPLYYYSFTDAAIAVAYKALTPAEQARFDPMITGFNPADMYGVDHIRRVLLTFPGVFSGIGEFSIHKEFVSSKISGETASLTNPALDRILDFAAESGLVVILHNDIDMPFAKTDSEPVYLTQMKALLKRHPRTAIIWAHLGLGRVVHPVQVSAEAAERNPSYLQIVDAMLNDPDLRHVNFDISWDEVAKYAIASPDSIDAGCGHAQPLPGQIPVRDRHGGARGAVAVFRSVRHVGAGLAPADAGRQPEDPQDQLRADVRRGTPAGTRLGKGERSGTTIMRGDRNMGSPQTHRPTASVWFLTASLVLGGTSAGWAQETSSGPSGESTTIAAQSPPPTKPSFEVYGFAMLDMGHNFKQIDPNWYDTLRITRLPKVANEFGADNSTFAGVRQSRLGFQINDADHRRRPEDHLRVRAVRHRRGRRTDHLPPAPCMGRTRRLRGRPVPGARSAIRTSTRTRWSTGARRVFPGTATCSSATRRSTVTPAI